MLLLVVLLLLGVAVALFTGVLVLLVVVLVVVVLLLGETVLAVPVTSTVGVPAPGIPPGIPPMPGKPPIEGIPAKGLAAPAPVGGGGKPPGKPKGLCVFGGGGLRCVCANDRCVHVVCFVFYMYLHDISI